MNAMTDITGERRLTRLWRVVRDGMPAVGRYRRYALSVAPALGLIWVSTGAYLLLVPDSYESEFTLILPGSGIGSTLKTPVPSTGSFQQRPAPSFRHNRKITLPPQDNAQKNAGVWTSKA